MSGLPFLPPGAGPATMPGSVPNFPPSPISGHGGLPPALPPGAMPSLPPPGLGGGMPPGAIPGQPSPFLPPGAAESSAPPEYLAETQSDGSVLLRIKNPDGTPGLVMQIIDPPKPRKNTNQGPSQQSPPPR